MKKIILMGFLLVGALGFSRVVNSCEITGKAMYNNGTRYINCISNETGTHFNFTRVHENVYEAVYQGESYKIYFEGKGYTGLMIDKVEWF